MEKRFLLAVVLSLFTLYIWTAVSPRPKKVSTFESFQENSPESVKVEEKIPNPLPSLAENLDKPATFVPKTDSETKTLDTKRLTAQFSNLGGSLDSILIKEYDTSLPLEGFMGVVGYENVPFKVEQISSDAIVYSFDSELLNITKVYKLSDDYTIHTRVSFSNKTSNSSQTDISLRGLNINMSSLDINKDKDFATDKALFEYMIIGSSKDVRKSNAHKFSPKDAKQGEGEVSFVGFRNRYFCAIVKPKYQSYGYKIVPKGEQELGLEIMSNQVVIPAGGRVDFDSTIFIGPEELNLLKGYDLGFEKVQKFYRFWLFDGIAKFIYYLMHMIYKVIPNWGVAILLVSVVVYFSMYPLTLRGMSSMKRMQSMQPKIAQLKEKYKDNPQKMNKEMMDLYKTEKINPLGGCFPFLLQMPVFIGLYQVLWRSVDFKGANFLWIDDLSQPDHMFRLPVNLPFIGEYFNFLPIVMMAIMFFQQKLSAKNMVLTEPAQIQQQKMMATIMPVFLGFIFYNFPSGLTLYFTMFYLFSTFTQWKISKQPKAA